MAWCHRTSCRRFHPDITSSTTHAWRNTAATVPPRMVQHSSRMVQHSSRMVQHNTGMAHRTRAESVLTEDVMTIRARRHIRRRAEAGGALTRGVVACRLLGAGATHRSPVTNTQLTMTREVTCRPKVSDHGHVNSAS